MKWFTFLLRHGLVVALVVGIAIVYVYRQQLFPKFFEQGAEEITLARPADESLSNESGKDARTPNEVDKTGQDDLSTDAPVITDHEITSSTTTAADQNQTTKPLTDQAAAMTTADQPAKDIQSSDAGNVTNEPVTKKQAATNENTSTMDPVTVTSPAKEEAGVTQADQQEMAKATPSVAEVAADKPDASATKVDKDHSMESAKTEMAGDTVTGNEGRVDSDNMTTGMMKDPLKTMSGMMQNPSQAMSGMLNPAAPGSGPAARDSAKTQAQPVTPGAASSQTQMAEGLSTAKTPPIPAPATDAGMQRAEVTLQQQYMQIINKARQAYWQGQYQQSVTYYQDAIMLMPESADGYGELGNVFYAQGEWDKAGESLYQAAIRLLDKGHIDKANNLLSIIRGLKHERAVELDKRIQGQQPGN